jgi:hypothetical protein
MAAFETYAMFSALASTVAGLGVAWGTQHTKVKRHGTDIEVIKDDIDQIEEKAVDHRADVIDRLARIETLIQTSRE